MDAEAWECLVDLYREPLSRFVASSLGGWCEDVPDIVQEVYVKACRSIQTFRGDASLRTWLYQIAVNSCKDHLKSGWHRRVVCVGLSDDVSVGAADPTAPLVEWSPLHEALASLPEEERQCIELRVIGELTGREIAQLLGRKESAVWTRVYSGLKRLRAALVRGE